MPDYYYVCADRDGRFFQGACTAGDEAELNKILSRRHLYMLWAEEKPREDPEERAIARLVLSSIELNEVVNLLIRRSQGHRLPAVLHASVPEDFGAAMHTADVEKPVAAEPAKPGPLAPAARPLERQRLLVYWGLIITALVLVLATPVQRLWAFTRQRANYRQAISDMHRIADIAQADYARRSRYAKPAMPGQIPEEWKGVLQEWPVPPCPGWSYSWDHWTAVPEGSRTLRVTLRDPDLYAVYYLCLNTADCASPTMWGHGESIEQVGSRLLRCQDGSRGTSNHKSRI